MSVRAPHYLLFSEARQRTRRSSRQGAWRFVLESVEGADKLEAVDEEPEVTGDRLELLAVVRGLEALDQPSRVTLVTRSPYVARGFRFGLQQWRENDWRWENFGEFTPVQNHDLWQRIDRAMHYHQVECRIWRFDSGHSDAAAAAIPADVSQPTGQSAGMVNAASSVLPQPVPETHPPQQQATSKPTGWYHRWTTAWQRLSRGRRLEDRGRRVTPTGRPTTQHAWGGT